MKIVIKQNYLILAVTVVLAVIISVLRFYPIFLQRAELGKEMEQQSLTGDEIKANCQRLPILRKQLQDLEPDVAGFDKTIPVGQQYASLFQRIAAVMDECQLSEQNVQPGHEIVSEGIGCIPLTIKCKGDFKQVYQFLARLEGFERIVRIEDLHLENDSNYEGMVSMNAKARVFFQTRDDDKANTL